VVQQPGGDVVTSVADVASGAPLSIRVADGRIAATTTDVEEDHG
jgi:exodeoxyribonuclease VII large subunit